MWISRWIVCIFWNSEGKIWRTFLSQTTLVVSLRFIQALGSVVHLYLYIIWPAILFSLSAVWRAPSRISCFWIICDTHKLHCVTAHCSKSVKNKFYCTCNYKICQRLLLVSNGGGISHMALCTRHSHFLPRGAANLMRKLRLPEGEKKAGVRWGCQQLRHQGEAARL